MDFRWLVGMYSGLVIMDFQVQIPHCMLSSIGFFLKIKYSKFKAYPPPVAVRVKYVFS